jgi:hypothetical protein
MYFLIAGYTMPKEKEKNRILRNCTGFRNAMFGMAFSILDFCSKIV